MRVTIAAAVALLGAAQIAAADLTYEDLEVKIPSFKKIPGLKALESDIYGATTDPFILALQRSKFAWTTAVCKADSDGDGQTNGQELGDPCCSWVETRNLFSFMISDPGNAGSTINLDMYKSIQCTKSEDAVEAQGKRKPTRTPRPTTTAPSPTYDDGSASSGSGDRSATIRKASGQQNQGSQTTSSATHATMATASAVATVLTVSWALL